MSDLLVNKIDMDILRRYIMVVSSGLGKIRKIITTDFKFKTLVTDGFSGYEQLMEEHPGAKLQHCLVHSR